MPDVTINDGYHSFKVAHLMLEKAENSRNQMFKETDLNK
jgi:hypothetical protein